MDPPPSVQGLARPHPPQAAPVRRSSARNGAAGRLGGCIDPTAGDVEDVAYDLDELKREVSSLMFKVDSARRDLDGLADTIDEEPDSETLRWQTLGVLGMIDHALRNSPDPAPAPSADLPPNVW